MEWICLDCSCSVVCTACIGLMIVVLSNCVYTSHDIPYRKIMRRVQQHFISYVLGSFSKMVLNVTDCRITFINIPITFW